MASLNYILLLFMLASGSLFLRKPTSQESRETKIYIVRFNASHPKDLLGSTTYMEVLNRVLDKGRKATDALIYSYKESFTGFAARLTDKERKWLEGTNDILGVEPSKNYELCTTRSWDFLGFPVNVNRAPANAESDLIIGVMDTGIWPDSDSFRDDGLGPPPSKWKGKCENITCNNKIIGARAYYTGIDPLTGPFSVIDIEGHGTHVASIAAGKAVGQSSFFGLGYGIARGGVPSARIAVYKVCWVTTKGKSCPSHDILKAMDDAISDGVDIISASLGSITYSYIGNSIAVGSFRAMKKGILTVAVAGNKGSEGVRTIENGAPWILTVAATTIDRKFVTDLELGNGQTFTGGNINGFQQQPRLYNLLLVTSAITNRTNVNVITYYTTEYVNEASETNPRGVITFGEDCFEDSPLLPLPGVCLTFSDGERIIRYANETRNPRGRIRRGRAIFDSEAPLVAWFSSKGPNPSSADILKPDICAPGFNILAAWPPNAKPSNFSTDQRSTPFNIISGTSMACPHVSAMAVYIKSFHPTWSPSAIKSAIMTTATEMSPVANPLTEFDYGSGQLNPRRVLEPGLVYDATDTDYLKFLCADGYTESEVQSISGDSSATCSNTSDFTTTDLNYPSISANVTANLDFSITFRRTVTNVESRSSVYRAHVNSTDPSFPLRLVVSPTTLSFSYQGQKRNFTVTVSGKINPYNAVSASLSWKDGIREVRSPILIYSI